MSEKGPPLSFVQMQIRKQQELEKQKKAAKKKRAKEATEPPDRSAVGPESLVKKQKAKKSRFGPA